MRLYCNYMIFIGGRSVHIGLETSEEVEGVLFVSYVVSQASWSSSYDVRVFTKDKAMKVWKYGC